MGLSHLVRGDRGLDNHDKIPDKILLHHRKPGQDLLAHTHHISLQENTHMVLLPLLSHKQITANHVASQPQALLYTESF